MLCFCYLYFSAMSASWSPILIKFSHFLTLLFSFTIFLLYISVILLCFFTSSKWFPFLSMIRFLNFFYKLKNKASLIKKKISQFISVTKAINFHDPTHVLPYYKILWYLQVVRRINKPCMAYEIYLIHWKWLW